MRSLAKVAMIVLLLFASSCGATAGLAKSTALATVIGPEELPVHLTSGTVPSIDTSGDLVITELACAASDASLTAEFQLDNSHGEAKLFFMFTLDGGGDSVALELLSVEIDSGEQLAVAQIGLPMDVESVISDKNAECGLQYIGAADPQWPMAVTQAVYGPIS